MTKLMLATLLLATAASTAHAAQFVTVLEATINVDRTELIQPTFCENLGPQDQGGWCSFVIVFADAEYTATVSHKEGFQASHKARDKMTVKVTYFGGQQTPDLIGIYENPAYKTKGEALRALSALRDLLPK